MPRESPAFHLHRLHTIANQRGGVALSKRYLGDLPRLKFRCAPHTANLSKYPPSSGGDRMGLGSGQWHRLSPSVLA